MSHPQLRELRIRLEAFLFLPEDAFNMSSAELLPHQEKTLKVYAPETGARVGFYGNVDIHPGEYRLVRVARMHFDWPGTGERERDLAGRLGLPAPEWKTVRRLRLDLMPPHDLKKGKRKRIYDEVKQAPYAVCDVEDAGRAADLCGTVLREVYGVPDSEWLWITDLPDNRDEWPVPLPKPAGWPAGVEWPPDY